MLKTPAQAFEAFVNRYILPRENATLLTLAISVGLSTGVGVWLFRQGIDLFGRVYRDTLSQGLFSGLSVWAIIPVLGIAGLLVGFLMERLIGEERHHGVAGIIESIALSGGRLPAWRMPIKAILASFSIGAGASVGPEDPSVQIGANLGSLFGQWLRMSDERVKLLVAAGVASGIAAAFRAPIAGVFFALEAVLGDFSTSAFGVVVLSAVITTIVTRAIDPGGAELGNWSYSLGNLQEIPFYVLLGLLLAPVSALFIKALYWQSDFWHHLKFRQPIKTLIAGLMVGLIAVFLPAVMGTGRDTMNQLLGQQVVGISIGLMFALAIGKMLATTISLGGGFVGGMFAPALFVGAVLGRAYGQILFSLSNGTMSATPAAFAIAGMAAAMTGVIRTPITAVLLLFELTDDYNMILPIMLTTVVCLFLVERLAPDGIYQLGLARKGFRVNRGRDVDLMQAISVKEAMSTEVQTISMSLPASKLGEAFEKARTRGLVVTDSDGLMYGIVTLQDYERAREKENLTQTTVAEICTKDVLSVMPSDPVSKAFQLMAGRDLGRIPVVDSARVIGIVRRRDIANAYNIALQRKIEGQIQTEQVRLAATSNAHVIELRVNANSPANNHAIRELAWPKGSIIATIKRNRQIIVPQGNTILQIGDILTVVTSEVNEHDISQIVAGAGSQR